MTSRPRRDFLLDSAEGDIYAPLTVEAATRAGVLRTEALPLSRNYISTTDAQIVAMAEERSYICAVTIVTGDPDDINLPRRPDPPHQHSCGRPRLIPALASRSSY